MLKKVVKTSNMCAVLMSKNILAEFTQIYNIATIYHCCLKFTSFFKVRPTN